MTLTERLQAQLAARAATNPRMRAILRRIQAGTASFSDTALYTRYLGEMLGGILADALPDAAPEEIAEAARVLLREAHADVTAQAAIVQEIQDRQLGASLAAKRPKYPAGRVEKVASSLADQTVPVETRQRRARNASANVEASYHDEFIKENARIRSDAGFSCKTVRLGTQCCPWCAKLTGSYPAGSEPRDLFRRHDNCTCTIIYETRRTRQTLRGQGKSWNVVEEVERKAPVRFSRDEAKALQEAEMGRYRGSTNVAKMVYLQPGIPLKSGSEITFARIDSEKAVSTEFAAEMREEIDKFTETFGELPDLRDIRSGRYRGDGVWGQFIQEERVIELYGIGGKNGKKQITQVAQQEKANGQWSTSSPFHPLRHELGHALQQQRELTDPNWTAKREEIENLRISIVNDLTDPDGSVKMKEMKGKLSKYGFIDTDEFISESIAEYLNGPEKTRSTAKKVIEILQRGEAFYVDGDPG